MVSFIIIGRNEGWRLHMCLKSTELAIKQCDLNSEIIYVDSQSTDNSLLVAKRFEKVKPFLIIGEYNAAIARNIGVIESNGECLVFLDGDMEISSSFLNLILDDHQNLKYEFVSGNFMNYYYDYNGNFLSKDYYKKIYCSEDTYQYTTGGLFAIKRKHWELVGGMKPMFKKGQDLDLGYRLAQKGIFLLRKKELMANHHTIDYENNKRLWKSFTDGSYVYPRAILYRSHVFNKYVIKRLLSSDPTWILLIVALIFTVITGNIIPLLLYVTLTFIAVGYSIREIKFKGLINRFVSRVFRDVCNLGALLLFYPSNNKPLLYKQI